MFLMLIAVVMFDKHCLAKKIERMRGKQIFPGNLNSQKFNSRVTNRRTDTTSQRDARTHLKKYIWYPQRERKNIASNEARYIQYLC